jgi:fucose permease
MAAGRLTGDWLTLRLGPGRLARSGGALVVLGIVLAVATTEPLAAIAGFGLIGAGVSCIFPLILSAAARTPGIAPGTAIAAMATSGYTGFLVGPPLIGSLAEALSLRGALGVLGVLGMLILVFGGAVGQNKGEF